MRGPRRIAPVQLALRSAVAATLSIALGRIAGFPFPIYAMIAAVIVMDLSPARTRRLAWQRVAGTVLGAGLGAALSLAGPNEWVIFLGIAAAMLACVALGLEDAAKLAGYVAAIVLLEHTATPWTYAGWRVAETLLGIAVAVGVSAVPQLARGAREEA
jgi:uncharacterized membrane protein YgaE (UPF0421/DUF939 family)